MELCHRAENAPATVALGQRSTCRSKLPPVASRSRRLFWRRAAGIAFGIGTQLLFAVTVWHLFFFLKDGGKGTADAAFSRDAFLAVQFCLLHSPLLHPAVRRKLSRYISSAFYGCFFCCVTCLTLLTTIVFWSPSDLIVYEATGLTADVIRWAFYGSWVALFYSLCLSGVGYQTGWTPWWHWFRGAPLPRRLFAAKGAYRLFRHPIYLSFLGLIWFTPRMSLDHALLTGLWTIYIVIGSYLKDERLAFYVGDQYREYQMRVPGYPLVYVGLLGIRRSKPTVETSGDCKSEAHSADSHRQSPPPPLMQQRRMVA